MWPECNRSKHPFVKPIVSLLSLHPFIFFNKSLLERIFEFLSFIAILYISSLLTDDAPIFFTAILAPKLAKCAESI